MVLKQSKETMFDIISKQKDCDFSLRFILQKNDNEWNLCFALLKLVKKGIRNKIEYNYGEYIVAERILTIEEGLKILEGLFTENGTGKLLVADYGEFEVNRNQQPQFLASKVNYGVLFDEWPMRFCSFRVSGNKGERKDTELLKEGLPYYPSVSEAIIDFFELATDYFSSYGEVYVVINDYRGRIKSLKLIFSKAIPVLELPEIKKEDLVVKAFAQSGRRMVTLDDVHPQNDIVEFDIGFNPEQLYVALLLRKDNLKIDGKEFGTWRGEKGVIVERPKEEVLFLTKSGESQSLEYKGDIVEEITKNDFIETVVAFSNTNRGVILVGVSDDGQILGTDIMAEDLERMIHDCCDPPPKNVKVERRDMDEGKSIIIVEVPFGDDRPYQSKRDKNFYVRHNANDMRIERSELISIIERIVQEREGTRISRY